MKAGKFPHFCVSNIEEFFIILIHFCVCVYLDQNAMATTLRTVTLKTERLSFIVKYCPWLYHLFYFEYYYCLLDMFFWHLLRNVWFVQMIGFVVAVFSAACSKKWGFHNGFILSCNQADPSCSNGLRVYILTHRLLCSVRKTWTGGTGLGWTDVTEICKPMTPDQEKQHFLNELHIRSVWGTSTILIFEVRLIFQGPKGKWVCVVRILNIIDAVRNIFKSIWHFGVSPTIMFQNMKIKCFIDW